MPNSYNNKVQLADGTVLIDLSSDTLSSADQLMQGIVAHDRTGATVTGELANGDEMEYGIIDATSSMVGVGKVGSMRIK